MNQLDTTEHEFQLNSNHWRFVYLGIFLWIAFAGAAFSAYVYGVEKGRKQALAELQLLEGRVAADQSAAEKKAPIRR